MLGTPERPPSYLSLKKFAGSTSSMQPEPESEPQMQEQMQQILPPLAHGAWLERQEADWLIVSEPAVQNVEQCIQLYHGTCLSQAQSIAHDGFIVGDGTKKGCSGVWGLWIEDPQFQQYPRGHAMERTRFSRGYQERPVSDPSEGDPWVCAWTCPAVIKITVPKDDLRWGFPDRVGSPPCRKACLPAQVESIVPLIGTGRNFELHVHLPTYHRFHKLQDFFPLLKGDDHTHVLCQTPDGDPMALLNGRFNVSCGRVERLEVARHSWTRTGGKAWVCFQCHPAHIHCIPYCVYPCGERVA